MRNHLMPEMKEGGVNVTPLIDVVMVLIIFFMLVAKIGVITGAEKDILPPETYIGTKIENLAGTLTLNVRDELVVREKDPATGNMVARRLSGRSEQPLVTALVEGADEPKPIPIVLRNEQGGIIDYPLRRVLDAAVKANPKLKLIILADLETEYYLLEQVLTAAAEAKVSDFNFQMREP
jgi:biopolymer transport protein ExbD